jgi:hypothetical protein
MIDKAATTDTTKDFMSADPLIFASQHLSTGSRLPQVCLRLG